MARFTVPEMKQQLDELTQKETVYKTEVDLAKHHLARTYDAARTALGARFTHGGKWQDLSEEDNELMQALPFELRHMFGKKFSGKLDAHADTDVSRALRDTRSEFQPLFDTFEALKARQVKGRRPVEQTKKVIGTRTQLRAICSHCFKEHAVTGDKLVAHGYTLEYGFQNGTCSGAGVAHFGTEAGRDSAARRAGNVRAQGKAVLETAQQVAKGTSNIVVKDARGRPLENPTNRQRAAHAARLRENGMAMLAYADTVDTRVAHWTPAEPREVEVEVTE